MSGETRDPDRGEGPASPPEPDACQDDAVERRPVGAEAHDADEWRDPSSTRPASATPVPREPAPTSGYRPREAGREHPPRPSVPGRGPLPAGYPGRIDDEVAASAESVDWPSPPERRSRPRTWINAVLFALTAVSVLYWAYLQYQSFYMGPGTPAFNPLAVPEALVGGFPFGLAVIVFLLSHEMGHYLACRWYDIDATLPYFIPMPVFVAPLLPGTMGAVIRIIAPIKSRRALFDIAVAGPIAGFVVSLPILAVGLSQSRVISNAQAGGYLTMGEPLIWEVMATWFGPATGPSEDLLVHPLAYVGWFAMLVTAMNLLPIGQLDGGHLLYALFPRVHRAVSLLSLGAMVVAGWFYFPGWIVFALIVFFLLGTRHPRPQRFESSLGSARLGLAVVAAAILVSSFILVPVQLGEFVG